MLEKIQTLQKDFQQQLENLTEPAAVFELKAQYLGKQGSLSGILKGLKSATPETRQSVGFMANQVKREMEQLIQQKVDQLERAKINTQLAQTSQDITARESLFDRGLQKAGYHPVTLVQRELEAIFTGLGFELLDGPYIEDEFHNFEALNIPEDHPARDMQDTFWFEDLKHLLRTHTSTIQVRGMKNHKPPFRFVGPGKVFRAERTDASHEMVFHQMEGMMVGKDISVANLIYFMKQLLSQIFQKEVEVRLRPGFFPFVEPGFELDISCLICAQKGCSVCKQSGWVELLPCGMVHPHVLKHGGLDPGEWNGFAFGLGLDRLVMMRYGIDDIRHLHSGNLQFSRQFASY